MRKQLKLLLLVATVLALFVMAMIVGSASAEKPFVAGGTEYATFGEAYDALGANGGTITLNADATMSAGVTIEKEITLDGGEHKLTLSDTVKTGYMFTLKANFTIQNVTLKHSLTEATATRTSGIFLVNASDVEINLDKVNADNTCEVLSTAKSQTGNELTVTGSTLKTSNTLYLIAGIAALDTVTFENCTLSAPKLNTEGTQCIVYLQAGTATFKNCEINTSGAVVYANGTSVISNFEDCSDIDCKNVVYASKTTKVNVKGTTVIYASNRAFVLSKGGTLNIGTQGQSDAVSITVGYDVTRIVNVSTTCNIYSGEITAASGAQRLFAYNVDACTTGVNIYGGTFIIDNGTPVFAFESKVTSSGTATVNKGTFVLSNGSTLVGGAGVSYATLNVTATTLGDITFKLGAGTADNATAQAYFNNATLWSKAKFYITSWSGVNVVENPTITTAGTYNQAQFEALLVEGEAIADPIPTYTGLGSFFVEGTNLFLDEGYAKTEIVYNTVTVNVDGTVTLKDVTFAASAGTWIEIVKGTLVLDNCNITVAEGASVTYFVLSTADGVTLTVTGGSYDMTNTSVEKPQPFKIGVRNKSRTETSSTENTVVSFENTSIYSKGSYVLGIEYIKSLTITNCFLSYTNAITKGEIDSVDAALWKGSNNGILTDAITTTISDTVIYAGNGTVAIQGRNDGADRQAPTVNLENVTIYADRGISYSVGAVNLTDCNFKAHPGDDRHISIQLAGTVTVTVVGGSFAQNETLTTKENNMFEFKAAGATLNISDATITAYVGNVFNFAEDAAGTLTVEDCYITVCGTEQSIVNDAAGTAKVTLTKCMFVVENVQETTVEEVTTKIALFVGKVDFVDVVVLAEAGTLVQGTYELDKYAQGVRYDTKEYKLWTADAGDFENSAEAGAGINEEHHGLKFDTEISSTVINGFIAEKTSKGIKDIRFYTLIAPMDYVAKAGGVFTKDALDAKLGSGNTNYVAIEAVHSLLGFDAETNVTTADAVKYAGTLIELNSDTRIYAAVSMIVFEYTDGTTDTFYGDFCSADNARTYNQVVATAAN